MSSKTRRELEHLVEAMDDIPIDEESANETVKKLGVDVKALAGVLRAKVTTANAAARQERFHQARRAYAEEVERLERRRVAAKRSRDEQLVAFRALLAKAPPGAVAAHFHKYESANDDELAELILALRHLLGEDDPE